MCREWKSLHPLTPWVPKYGNYRLSVVFAWASKYGNYRPIWNFKFPSLLTASWWVQISTHGKICHSAAIFRPAQWQSIQEAFSGCSCWNSGRHWVRTEWFYCKLCKVSDPCTQENALRTFIQRRIMHELERQEETAQKMYVPIFFLF
jgi:hypothetical protein